MKKAIIRLIWLVLVLSFIGTNGLALNIRCKAEMTADMEDLKKLLPTEQEIPGWKIASEPRFFEPGNLWEYINGQAELYLLYGFQLVVTADYSTEDEASSAVVEIYQMESPLHGFGIYAAERSPEDNFIKVGVQGYSADDILNFWKGPYYIKITSFDVSNSMKENLLNFSKVIADKISGNYSEPALFTYFPDRNKIRMSERYIPQNFMGHRFLKNGYRVDYQNKDINYQVFLAENSSPEEAEEAFAQYQEFLKSNSEIVSQDKKADYLIIKVKDRKNSIIFQYQYFIGGVQKIEDFSMGEEIIEEILGKLKSQK